MARHDPLSIRRARRLARLVGALVGVIAGIFYSLFLITNSGGALSSSRPVAATVLLGSSLVGLIAGFLAGPLVSVEPFLWAEDALVRTSLGQTVGAAVGLVVALLVAVLVGALLTPLPAGLGTIVALALGAVLAYLGVTAGTRRYDDVGALLARVADHVGERASRAAASPAEPPPADGRPIAVDTSVLIDGRIVDVARAGFIQGRLVIPGFVLEELQRVADSGDAVRRAKGRRGLAVVEELRQLPDVTCDFVDLDFPGVPDVDARLVRLARARDAAVMTNDFNLNRLATIEGLRVLNLNQLANALKPIVSAGESLQVTVVKEGKEPHQGVAYLDDGTMVVVENGRRHLDSRVTATVTSVLQTPAGRMIFAAVPAASAEEPRPRPMRPSRSRAAR